MTLHHYRLLIMLLSLKPVLFNCQFVQVQNSFLPKTEKAGQFWGGGGTERKRKK
jgi:hypothetical protein